jgi:hypothetical protein
MKCELAQQKIAIFAYGELSDEECPALEQHLAGCAQCRLELEAVQALQQAMSLAPVQEPSANLLARARLRLEEALDSLPPMGWLARRRQSIVGAFVVLRSAPAGAAAILLLGLGLGTFAGYRSALRHGSLVAGSATLAAARLPQPAGLENPAAIAEVSSIEWEPNSENVMVVYSRLVPEKLQGPLDDPLIRRLLLMGAESRVNPGVQQNSVSLLARECRAGRQCSESGTRKTLMVALRYGRNPAVRLKALEGLEPYVAEDMRVRDAVLEALMNDPDTAIRSRAIALLQPVQADTSVQQVLQTVASEDDNPYIRTVSRQVLNQTPEIQ